MIFFQLNLFISTEDSITEKFSHSRIKFVVIFNLLICLYMLLSSCVCAHIHVHTYLLSNFLSIYLFLYVPIYIEILLHIGIPTVTNELEVVASIMSGSTIN